MAFPVVEATNISVSNVVTSTHTVNLPAGIVAGDLLIAIVHLEGSNNSATFPAGWTELFDVVDSGNKSSMVVAWRDADGTEGASITVTSAVAGLSSHNTYRISGAEDPLTQAPEAANFPDRDNPDPPNLTPTGGAKDYLWIAASGHVSGDDYTAAPTNYTNLITASGGGASDCGSGRRNLNAASEDPGLFTPTTTDHGVACTIAIHPAPVAVVMPCLIMAPYIPA